MKGISRKIKAYLELLDESRYTSLGRITEGGTLPCAYKESGTHIPCGERFLPYDTENDTWGTGNDTHAWFHFYVDIPEGFEDDSTFLNISTGDKGWDSNNPQFIAYVDGKLVEGLDVNHTKLFINGAGQHEVYLYAYTGIKIIRTRLNIELFRLHREVEKLWYDIKVPYDSLSYIEKYSGEYRKILAALDEALLLLDVYEVPSPSFYRSVHEASEYMDKEFYGKLCTPPNGSDPVVIGIGHTHIDCAWKWTLRQTREKVQRSFSTVVELMRRYPEYKFMSSQALLYKNIKEEAPDVYESIRKLIAEGRWECEGAMWVEADCNLSSGESLVRQIMYGKRFFKEEFGIENRVLWLPDVFGYSASLPQILRKSGVDWFVTSKISWNDTNIMPYDTFIWKGIDGTGINTYFLTAQDKKRGQQPTNYTTYVAHITPAMVAGTYDRYQQKELSDKTLITFGYGDGGGGPTDIDLETAKRLSCGIPGTPAVKIGFAGDFLKELEGRIDGNHRLPVWQGELYLECHRGTYTTIAKNKKNNRRSEELYIGTELMCSMAKLLLGTPFPKKELHEGWEMILTNQFHDIIPGSSIHEVYEQSDIDYAKIKDIAAPYFDSAQAQIAQSIGKDHGYVVFNPNPTKGCGIVQHNGKSVYISGIPSKGYACVNEFKDDCSVIVSKNACESKLFRLTFDESMILTSIYDKINDREVLKEGERGNQLRVYADRPDRYDAWEWTDFSMEKHTLIDNVSKVEEVRDGVRAGIRITRKHMSSTVTQTVWLYDDIGRIDFDTEIDWQERHQMLKAAFPVDVNSYRATYEVQYGTIERPTHKNTSWDAAKFEVCAHRFADISDGGYGVTMLNDCKYGHDIHDGVMMLSLLRSPTFPDPWADLGMMSCTYSICPHAGNADITHLYELAYDLNSPMTMLPAIGDTDVLSTEFSMVSCDRQNILCEVVKEAEDSEDIVFRFFECANTRTPATLSFGFDIAKAELCDMLENTIEKLDVTDNKINLGFGAFEIHTLKVTPA